LSHKIIEELQHVRYRAIARLNLGQLARWSCTGSAGFFFARTIRRKNMSENSHRNRFVMDSIEGIKLIHPDGTETDIKDIKVPPNVHEEEEEGEVKICFTDYLKDAWDRTRQDADKGCDNGDLEYVNRLCRRGVLANWSDLEPKTFLETYHRCIAVISRKVAVVETFLPSQVALFRNHDAARIMAEQESIWDEWSKERRCLNHKMVNAMIETSKLLNGCWDEFRHKYLPMPENPESESLDDWQSVHSALDRLRMVGPATAWYLIRNLYGAPAFKPDVHICAIATYFFPNTENSLTTSLTALSESARKLWAKMCDDKRFLPVHLGEVDYILWWYRQATGLPEIPKAAAASC
jgi:hypothetical protein